MSNESNFLSHHERKRLEYLYSNFHYLNEREQLEYNYLLKNHTNSIVLRGLYC